MGSAKTLDKIIAIIGLVYWQHVAELISNP